MTFVILRTFLKIHNGRTTLLSSNRISIMEHAPSVFFTNNAIRGFASTRLPKHSGSKALEPYPHVLSNISIKGKRIYIYGSRLASTFVVETPGKFGKTAGESLPNSPASNATATSSTISDPIPEPPSIPVEEIVTQAATISTEPTFASLGLGGWTPVGIVENCMEFLHVDCGIPWWFSIAIGTFVVRLLMFPLVIVSQKNAAKMNNNLPQLQVLQMKMTEARQEGNHLEAARYAQELMIFMREKKLSPFKNMLVPLAQAPIFISFFMALRGMSNLPVPGMETGGLWWFTDLTMPDQYFLLPLMTSATLYLTIELGTDSARLNSQNLHLMKYVLRALPICIFPFTLNFSGAVLCYWLSSNVVSLCQVGFLKIPVIRQFFNIEQVVYMDPQSLPNKPKGFVEGFRESMKNMRITREMEERERFDEMQFKRAGTAPIQKTYKYDPTRTREAISAKKRSS